MKLHEVLIQEAPKPTIPKVELEYIDVLRRYGFDRKPSGKYYKTAGAGTIEIDKHGHWAHLGVDTGYEGGADFEGTTAETLNRHLINKFWPRAS